MPEDYIVIVTDEADEVSMPIDGEKGWGEEVRKRISSIKEVRLPVSQLEENMNQFLQLCLYDRRRDRSMLANPVMLQSI